MAFFKTPAERKTWMQVRCLRIGERLNVECQRTGFNPAWVQLDTYVELHKVSAFPALASNLHADWLAMAWHHGIDLQYVLAGVPAPDRADSAIQSIANVYPTTDRAARTAWTAAHRGGIGQRLAEQLGLLRLDLTPWAQLSNLGEKAMEKLPEGSGVAADLRADFLSLLADKGVDTRYVLTGVRSPNWPPVAARGVA